MALILALLPLDMAGATAHRAWTTIGSMTTVRQAHTATLLLIGEVLVAGGCGNPSCTPGASAELYNPWTGAWTLTGSMATARADHSATLLADGDVLVAGGCTGFPICSSLSSAELYDPHSHTWQSVGSMTAQRLEHVAILLPSGQVLVAGGRNCSPSCYYALASAELYDPRTGTWSATGSMSTGRIAASAARLPDRDDGRVLVAGGAAGSCTSVCTATASAEIYDPRTGRFTPTGSMHVARMGATATLLFNGEILVTGGCPATDTSDNCPNPLASAELYNPLTGRWTLTGTMSAPREEHTSTLLYSGKVLIAAGDTSGADLYDPRSGEFTPTGALPLAIYRHTATLLPDGRVLVAGGCAGTPYSCYLVANAEVYTP